MTPSGPAVGFSDPEANLYNPGSRSVSVNIMTAQTPPSNPTNPSTPPSRPSTPSQNVTEKSDNNNLSSLTVDLGELSPKFNSKITEYSVELPFATSSINVSATSEDSKAIIDNLGLINLKDGDNVIDIVVTSETGSKKTYTIKVHVNESPLVTLKYNDNNIGVIEVVNDSTIPSGFTKGEYKINNHSIPIFINGNLTIVYGMNNDGQKNFYVFNKDSNECSSKFTSILINDKLIYFIDPSFNSDNMVLSKISIDKNEIVCNKFLNNPNYCLLSTINNEGNIIDYLYEETEKTIQLYPKFLSEVEILKDSNNEVIIIILSILLILFISLSIFLFYKLKGGKNHEKAK